MAFENLPMSKPKPRHEKKPEIFCVGWNAFVHWPAPRGPVPLTDTTGKPLANDLTDGQQVEIVSWRPRSREGLMYQVRRLTDSSVWWIEARYLRRHAVAERVAQPG
jgi:hypothetical protein